MESHHVVIGLGSNLGDREKYLATARERLATIAVTPLRWSGIYESPALGGGESAPDYLNQVVEFDTRLEAMDLLYHLKGFERLLGRKSRGHWMSREIDLDILLFDNEVLEIDCLRVPHLGIPQRQFLLRPLCDLSPRRVHPLEGVTFEAMLKGLEHFEGKLVHPYEAAK